MSAAISTTRAEIGSAWLKRLPDFNGDVKATSLAMLEAHPSEFTSPTAARHFLSRYRRKVMAEARGGHSPEHDFTHRVPEGFAVKGVSSYYDEKGDLRGQWVKSNADDEKRQQIIEEGVRALSEDIPRLKPVKPPRGTVEPLCNLYTLTDCHLGMMASLGEAGEKWGLEVAEQKLGEAFEALMAGAPPAKRCVISQLGDFLHSDGLTPETPASRHTLDADARFPEMVRAAYRLLRRMVDAALHLHGSVELVIAEGNHDPASSVHLRVGFENLYEKEKRLTVIDSDLPYYVTTHGETMLGFHHGHIKGIKTQAGANELALFFASSDEWRTTKKRYIHTGHVHTEKVQEVNGAKLFSHPTLVAPDAYASRNFGGSHREMTSHTYHDVYGKVGTNTITPEMLK